MNNDHMTDVTADEQLDWIRELTALYETQRAAGKSADAAHTWAALLDAEEDYRNM